MKIVKCDIITSIRKRLFARIKAQHVIKSLGKIKYKSLYNLLVRSRSECSLLYPHVPPKRTTTPSIQPRHPTTSNKTLYLFLIYPSNGTKHAHLNNRTPYIYPQPIPPPAHTLNPLPNSYITTSAYLTSRPPPAFNASLTTKPKSKPKLNLGRG